MDKPKMVVAYSGGLDTSVMVKWLHEKFNADVITATGDLGQSKELEGVKQKAFATGAVKAHIKDLKAEFLEDYVFPALRAGALYEGAYPMATSLGRPLLAKVHGGGCAAGRGARWSPTAAPEKGTTRCASRSRSTRWLPISK